MYHKDEFPLVGTGIRGCSVGDEWVTARSAPRVSSDRYFSTFQKEKHSPIFAFPFAPLLPFFKVYTRYDRREERRRKESNRQYCACGLACHAWYGVLRVVLLNNNWLFFIIIVIFFGV
jgi:hypothetical protein